MGAQGDVGLSGQRGKAGTSISNGRVLTIFLVMMFAFVVLAVAIARNQHQLAQQQQRQDRQQQQITGNLHLIQQSQYNQCLLENQNITRQSKLIGFANAAELRKPVPDLKLIADRTALMGVLLTCGPAPR